ncbi:Acyl-CoA dehydrogenase family protein [Planktothrix serta PCC 8927]|uniref:Acyl-CoA dehydrogenase family protein n=1 Tax=Planktothrix serta PCC 8927 TaxID=671068 RepID=A0A7Z9BY75_9CYAN|nr:acyl-CoA dehydrogenase family protein [Planktothrix serta]VXD21750.1 Acyl-CoA dehydrogenase family protein [Planktothrix serta PCC 8927]
MSELLQQTESYLKQKISPDANQIDGCSKLLQKAFNGLGALGVLGLRIPHRWGGPQLDAETCFQFQELIARYSGALAFLQTQHQSVAAMLIQSYNTQLQAEYLPRMSQGNAKIGVGFSHLRRLGNPSIIAIPVRGGYQLNGFVPWVTGWGIFEEFVVAATLPDNQSVWGLVPFSEQKIGESAIKLSSPMSLCAMTSTNTVTATFTQWFLPEEKVVSIHPVGWMQENDQTKVLQASFLALGCARAGLEIVETAFKKTEFSFIQDAFNSLNQELNQCRSQIFAAQNHPQTINTSEKYQLRAWAIELAVRCAQAAVTVSSGAANLNSHSAQRIYREALVFTVSGQTTELMKATLEKIKNCKVL